MITGIYDNFYANLFDVAILSQESVSEVTNDRSLLAGSVGLHPLNQHQPAPHEHCTGANGDIGEHLCLKPWKPERSGN